MQRRTFVSATVFSGLSNKQTKKQTKRPTNEGRGPTRRQTATRVKSAKRAPPPFGLSHKHLSHRICLEVKKDKNVASITLHCIHSHLRSFICSFFLSLILAFLPIQPYPRYYPYSHRPYPRLTRSHPCSTPFLTFDKPSFLQQSCSAAAASRGTRRLDSSQRQAGTVSRPEQSGVLAIAAAVEVVVVDVVEEDPCATTAGNVAASDLPDCVDRGRTCPHLAVDVTTEMEIWTWVRKRPTCKYLFF